MEKEIEMVSVEEFNERLESYKKQNSLLVQLLKNKTWEELPSHLIQDLFKRMGCKPIINKY